MEQVRCFMALELPNELKLWLGRLQDRLKSNNQPWLKWVNVDGIHLTLKFLGNVGVDRLNETTRAMAEAAQGIPPFHLEVTNPGVFPNLRRVRVVWVGIGGEVGQLVRLQQRIEDNLAHLGFARESRPFTPHLTLARVGDQASPDERQAVGQVVANASLEASYVWEVDTVSLMKSQLTRQGAVYHLINPVRLRKPLSTATT